MTKNIQTTLGDAPGVFIIHFILEILFLKTKRLIFIQIDIISSNNIY